MHFIEYNYEILDIFAITVLMYIIFLIKQKSEFSIFISFCYTSFQYLNLDWHYRFLRHCSFLAHLIQRVMWGIAITWRPASVCKLFQKSSPLKPLGQFKPNVAWIILRGFPLKVMSDDPVDQPSWPPCL